jgi:hypothetical protein
MKWEELILVTSEISYKKFSWQIVFTDDEKNKKIDEMSIIKSMTNFQKWVYFLLKIEY